VHPSGGRRRPEERRRRADHLAPTLSDGQGVHGGGALAAQHVDERVDDHVARTGVERHDLVELRLGRDEGDVGDAADALQPPTAEGA
jgi:hypothetical protein